MIRPLYAAACTGSIRAVAEFTRVMRARRKTICCACGCGESLESVLRWSSHRRRFLNGIHYRSWRDHRRNLKRLAAAAALILICGVGLAQPPMPPLLVTSPPQVCDETVSLAWDAPNPLGSIVGFKVYWGYAPGRYAQAMDCGLDTFALVQPLCTFRPVFFAVASYDQAGFESMYSGEMILDLATTASYTTVATTLEVAESPGGPWRTFAVLPSCVRTNRTYPTNIVPEKPQFFRSRVNIQQTNAPP